MTPAETLRAAVEADDPAAVRAVLVGRPEEERAELVPVAREIVKAAVGKGIEAVGHLQASLLVAYGVLPVSDLRKLGWRTNHLPAGIDAVLRDRSAERLEPIVDHLLADATVTAWRNVRPLVRSGAIARPDSPAYTLAMLAATRWSPASALIADDPDLAAVEVWRLFEVEGGGEDSLANYEKYYGDSWGDWFRELASRDPAARRRLLDASLAALARDFSTYRAGWFSRFHETLAPTDAERAERATAYLGLLRSRVGPTVSFAVAALRRAQAAGALPPDALLDRIGPVLADAPKTSAKAALGLVEAAARGPSGDLRRRAAVAAANALGNPAADIQGAAIGLIAKLQSTPDAEVAQAVAARAPDVAATQRSAVEKLLGRLGVEAVPRTIESPIAAAFAVRAPVSPMSPVAPVAVTTPTSPDRAIEPVTTIDDLVDVAVGVLETGEPADDIERVLDAIGRLTATHDGERDRLMQPLARRARTILGHRESRPFVGTDVRSDLAAVVLAFATGTRTEPARAGNTEAGAGAFLSARAREFAEAAASGRPFVSVAAPTHRGGWIDPPQLVDRLRVGPPASVLDLVAAVLRLAGDGRKPALDAARDLPGEVGSAVRHALGGDGEDVGPTAAWWVAAARVRAPGEDDPRVERRHPGLGPDAARAARLTFHRSEQPLSWRGLGVVIDPPRPDIADVSLPTTLLLRVPSTYSWGGKPDPTMLRWISTVWPGDRTSWAAVGALVFGWNIDWWQAEWANRAFLEPFLAGFTPIGTTARLMLGVTLGAKEVGERGLAADVVGLALADGRLNGAGLAEGLTAAAEIGADRPARWATSLADVAALSDDHASSVAEAIAGVLPAIADRGGAKLVALLRVLDELLAARNVPVADHARASLETLAKAGGETSRVARSVLGRR